MSAGIAIGLWWAALGAHAAPGPGGGASASARPAAPSVLDNPAFTATPAELLALAKAAPKADDGTVVLRERRDVSFDDQGRATVRTWSVSVVQTVDVDDDDGEIGAGWNASYQDRPVIRARVIAPTGVVVELDPAKLGEASPTAGAAARDRHYVGGQLPVTIAGSVVEREVTVIDGAPPPGGGFDIADLSGGAQTSSTVISYTAPVSLKLRRVERNLPAGVRPRHRVASGRETWIYEIGARPAWSAAEPLDAEVQPYIGVTTATSWASVARDYRRQVDQRIADGGFALPSELPRTASAETVDAIHAWFHRRVHVAQTTQVIRAPRPPAEIVASTSGDGNDLAALLVALLRQAGIRADVALARDWGLRQPDPELPGLGAFDHALVRVQIGAREIWIDPAADARPGQLPDHLRGRRALVIADDTTALATTPTAIAADNTVRDVRTFVAAEAGRSQLTRVVRYRGGFEIDHRSMFRPQHGAMRRVQEAREIAQKFGATVDEMTVSDPDDLGTPLESTAKAHGATQVFSDPERIDIVLRPADALDGLDVTLRMDPDPPRRGDVVLARPQIYEIETRIEVPSGVTLRVPRPERVLPIGAGMTFTERQRIEGTTLIVSHRLETGKLRLSPSELSAMRTVIRDLERESEHITLPITAFELAKADKPAAAIAECERLIALHPREALHHSQLARVLLDAGAGGAARAEARKAVAMAPGDADPLVVLGAVLSHDTLGRPFAYDWDRPGAIAALEQARKLDPKHVVAQLALARALQRDAAGRRFEGPDLARAAEVWRLALALGVTDELVLEFAQLLIRTEQFAEAERVARKAETSEARDRLIVAAIAGSGGAAAAIAAADALRDQARRNPALASAAAFMMLVRHYDVARELVAASGTMARAPAAITAVIQKLSPQPEVVPRAGDPKSAVLELQIARLDQVRKTEVFWDARAERDLRRSVAQAIPAVLRSITTTRWLGDLIAALVEVSIEDGGSGVWRAKLDAAGASERIYLALDRGAVKVLGTAADPSGVGRYLLGRDPRTDAASRRLLDWLVADVDKTSARGAALQRVWSPGAPASHDAIRLAAAVVAGPTDPDRVIAIASRCPSTLPDAELACHDTLFAAYRARGKSAEAARESDAILAARPGDLRARAREHAQALARAGRFDDAEHVLDEILAKQPTHALARLARLEVAAIRGDVADVVNRARAIGAFPAVTAPELNDVAWYEACAGADLTGALELARKAAERLPKSGGIANTLAVLEAQVGDLGHAIRDNRNAMELRNIVEPEPGDWLAVGLIREQLGQLADAADAYRRVTREPGVDAVFDAYTLAQRRLAARKSWK